jgi:hypothetical protein
LGAAYFIPTLLVPLMLITHALAFRILLLNPDRDRVVEYREGKGAVAL